MSLPDRLRPSVQFQATRGYTESTACSEKHQSPYSCITNPSPLVLTFTISQSGNPRTISIHLYNLSHRKDTQNKFSPGFFCRVLLTEPTPPTLPGQSLEKENIWSAARDNLQSFLKNLYRVFRLFLFPANFQPKTYTAGSLLLLPM
ncbi:hypothetical protein BaRGS_00007876 [Batillaria attramentaria]|uniref:Uncharacterized protein n=1 Tax=Batillaria attramentaria TaxID=370345 RepID=A0ABD0LNF5_9CAEN